MERLMSLKQNKIMLYLCVSLIVITVHLVCVGAYSRGAGDAACYNGVPNHFNTNEQSDLCPYSITTTQTAYSPGGTVEVTVKVSEPDVVFKGFLCQATTVSSDKIIGTWFNQASGPSKLLKCDNPNDSVTHVNSGEKTSITLTWNAPTDIVGEIQFRCTVVQSYKIYWVHMKSLVLGLQ
ncbi:unnamed protein product [Owenia fusiformis]|uniref:Reelin domain-containing protein n=1 Tax=Owenia fusiformis TaxID=6347 RepID=A0A8S4NAS1_OWEFU|nr:unnamed protein product [Owenia fusiformis]